MSHLLARIMLALLMLPMAGVIYVICVYLYFVTLFGIGNAPGSETPAMLFAGLFTWMFVMVYWTMLWRRNVRWTPVRLGITSAAPFAAAIIGVGGGMIVTNVDTSFGVFFGGILTMVAWLTMSVFIWRETAAERTERIRARSPDAIVCPGCGYNLTGLKQTTCPECGASYRIDELIAMQPGADEDVE